MSDGTARITVKVTGSKDLAYALVDRDDYPHLLGFTWRFDGVKVWREVSKTVNRKRTRRVVRLHRQILQAPFGMVVDHINRNPLDNRKSNLRVCTQHQNTFNSGGRKRRVSKYKGVYPAVSRKNPWRAQICIDQTFRHLGMFTNQEDAAHAYNRAAVELHGEYACLNDVPDAA